MEFYEIYDRYHFLNGTEAGKEALKEYALCLEDGKSEEEAEVVASNHLQRRGYNVNRNGGVCIRKIVW